MKLFKYKGLDIVWTGHAGFRVSNGLTMYFDPYNLRRYEPADVIFISHDHFDHFSEKDIRKISSDKTFLICADELMNKVDALPGEKVFIKPGNEYRNDDLGISVYALPAYNINKFRAPGIPFHPKEDGKLGFIVTFSDVVIYHAGDTDFIPEMKDLKDMNIDVALLPVSGTYVMTPEEAAEAAKAFSPKYVIPMHWGAIVAGRSEADKFKMLMEGSGIEVVVLEAE
jgi:L-ascorbate metabolism protein UlaG (beta-lactamase superfamily)